MCRRGHPQHARRPTGHAEKSDQAACGRFLLRPDVESIVRWSLRTSPHTDVLYVSVKHAAEGFALARGGLRARRLDPSGRPRKGDQIYPARLVPHLAVLESTCALSRRMPPTPGAPHVAVRHPAVRLYQGPRPCPKAGPPRPGVPHTAPRSAESHTGPAPKDGLRICNAPCRHEAPRSRTRCVDTHDPARGRAHFVQRDPTAARRRRVRHLCRPEGPRPRLSHPTSPCNAPQLEPTRPERPRPKAKTPRPRRIQPHLVTEPKTPTHPKADARPHDTLCRHKAPAVRNRSGVTTPSSMTTLRPFPSHPSVHLDTSR